MKDYVYETDCVNADGDDINAMKDAAKQVTYATMLRRCEGLIDWAVGKSYARSSRQGLTLKKDWHVAYYKSVYRGQPCYYLVWSAIENVWVKQI